MFSSTKNYLTAILIAVFSFVNAQSVSLSFGTVDESSGTMEILMSNDVEVAGFQFNISGATITGASGGSSTDNGFSTSTGGSTVLGFSFSGSTIPAGSGILTILEFSDLGTFSCIEDAVISGLEGANLDVNVGDCIGDPPIFGCTDSSACNYNADATDDDGSCTFAEDFYDCDGNLTGALVQIVHNSASPTVDVYIDGTIALENFTYRAATPVLTMPTTFNVGIAPAGGSVIADFPFDLEAGGSYVVVATGLLNNDDTPFGLAATASTFGATDGNVGLNVYHGSTDAPSVDVLADGSILVGDLLYSEFSGYVEVPASDYTIGIAPTGSDPIAEFLAPISGLSGASAVVFASGFLSPAESDPAFGLFAALEDGTVLELPQISIIEILYDSPLSFNGFQFNINGVTVLDASGGAAEENGFTVSTGATTVIGFSLTGGSIDPGNGILTTVQVQGNPADACIESGVTSLVISDQSGEQLYSWVDNCLTINMNLPDPPQSPSDLTAMAMGNDIDLSWSASDNADGYYVYQDGIMSDMTIGTSYTSYDLSFSTTYNFCVSAFNAGGESAQSCVDATTDEAPPEPLIAPENLTAEAGDTVVLLNWDDPPGEIAGTLTVNLTTDQYAAETSWELVDASGTLVASNPALANETEYSNDYELEAGSYTWTIFDSWGDGICCGYGYGGYQLLLDGVEIANGGEFGAEESVQFSTDGMLISLQTGYYVESHNYEKGEYVNNWQSFEVEYSLQEFQNVDRDLIGYNIYRSDVSGSGYVNVGSTDANTTTYLDEGLMNESTYYYVVSAIYDGGESDFSNEVSATPMPYVPDPATNLIAEAGDGLVDLSWGSPGGFGGFPACPDGSAEYVDCAGTCFNNADCADGTYDGCVEGNNTWLGDGFCDDGSFNLVFWLPDNECPEYGNDCGDCGAFDPDVDDPGGVCGGSGGTEDCTSIDNFNVTSPEDCLENTNYFSMTWDGGCTITTMNYGVYDVNENPLDLTGTNFNGTLNFYGFGPSETYLFEVCAGDICSDVVSATSSSTDCGGGDESGPTVIATHDMPPELVKNFNPSTDNFIQTREELTGFDILKSDVMGGPYTSVASVAS